jgi:citrate lyase beta subunit
MAIRPRRSVLYMPGSNVRALEKAKTLHVDGVIVDLEDSVAPRPRKQPASRRPTSEGGRLWRARGIHSHQRRR